MTGPAPSRRPLQPAERAVFALLWAFLVGFGAFILATDEVSLSTTRAGVVWSTGDAATAMALLFIGLGGLLAPLLLPPALIARRPVGWAMLASALLHLAIAAACV